MRKVSTDVLALSLSNAFIPFYWESVTYGSKTFEIPVWAPLGIRIALINSVSGSSSEIPSSIMIKSRDCYSTPLRCLEKRRVQSLAFNSSISQYSMQSSWEYG